MKRLPKKLLLAAGSLLAVALLAEGGLRVLGYGRLLLYDTHPLLLWVPRPNQRCLTKVNLRPETIDAEGFRGAETTRDKPPGVFRIACLGDSVTFGWGVADGETYEAVLERRLRAAGGRFEVLNAGVNAYCVNQEGLYLREKVLAFSPDLVTVGFSHNEGWQNFAALSPQERDRVLAGVRCKNRLRSFALYHFFVEIQMRALYDLVRQKYGTPSSIDPRANVEERLRAYDRDLDSIADLCRGRGVGLAFLVFPVDGQEKLGTLQNRMLEAGARLGVPAIDFSSALAGRPGEPLFIDGDRVHPNEKGHAAIAARLEQELARAGLLPRP